MLKDKIFKTAMKIAEEKQRGADKAPLQYQDKIEIIVSQSTENKQKQENNNA